MQPRGIVLMVSLCVVLLCAAPAANQTTEVTTDIDRSHILELPGVLSDGERTDDGLEAESEEPEEPIVLPEEVLPDKEQSDDQPAVAEAQEASGQITSSPEESRELTNEYQSLRAWRRLQRLQRRAVP